MHRAGRVGRDVFDVDLAARRRASSGHRRGPPSGSRPARRCQKPAPSLKLTKPGPATSAALDVRIGLQRCREPFGEVARLLAGGLASTIAALVARSPCAASRGGSTDDPRKIERDAVTVFADARRFDGALIRSLKSAKMFMALFRKAQARVQAGLSAPALPQVRAYRQTSADAR